MMDVKQKYDHAFVESFALDATALNDELQYNGITEWDSIGHMTLIAALEEAFGVVLETDDIVEFSSYRKGMEIMKKYGLEI